MCLTNLRVSFDFLWTLSLDPDTVAIGLSQEHTVLLTKNDFQMGPQLTIIIISYINNIPIKLRTSTFFKISHHRSKDHFKNS